MHQSVPRDAVDPDVGMSCPSESFSNAFHLRRSPDRRRGTDTLAAGGRLRYRPL